MLGGLVAAHRIPPFFILGTSLKRKMAGPSCWRAGHHRVTGLHPALFLIVLHGARMQRRGQAILDHMLRIEVGEGRMQLLEVVEVLEQDRKSTRLNSSH